MFDRSKRFTFILTEQAVRYPLIPPDGLAMQMERLASFTHQPNIRLGVIPMGVPFTSGALNTFTVYDETLATAELDLGAIVFRDHRDVLELIRRFTAYTDHAVFGEEAREHLATWAAKLRH
ncbi:Scr1 family TA system antitoxin-like transcriptional regulator [Streptomyces sp. MAR4 CNX-425]|uniref:Scr1 family TA system antitoxin-like transcriptional regulator n=1 Tax=Streptomyces sp. MAR4 CNX-425 TaxID=3406343 RepID=UPI003B510D1B